MARFPNPRLAARRFRLILEGPVETPDSLGGASIAFTPIATLWAAVERSAGREAAEAERVQGVVECRITIPFREGTTPQMRFRQGDNLFPIRAAFDPDGRRRVIVCLCEEIVP